jgi:hypothetical protein
MDYKIEVLRDHQIILGRFNGPLNKENAANYFKEVASMLSTLGTCRLLTDLSNAQLKANEFDASVVSKYISQMDVIKSCKRAVVIKRDVKFYKLWENHNLKSGLRNMRLFLEEEKALEWLMLES